MKVKQAMMGAAITVKVTPELSGFGVTLTHFKNQIGT